MAWETSSHNFVSCVECHYPPGSLRRILYKKFQALSEVAKYVTRTYSSKPFAQIEDEACLREGCHSKRILHGKVITEKGVNFDHRPHITETRKGRQLRCVSCHSQMVIGKHIEVTWDTCYLCHLKTFKKGREFVGITPCVSCHNLPDKDFKIGDITYNHRNFLKKKEVACENCHQDAIVGNGEALEDRCFTCHNQPEKLEKKNEIIFLHEAHVTDHHVACFHCHREIKHKVRTYKPLASDCSECHTDKHKGATLMYKGKGAALVKEIPSPMYLANVDCVGCHIKPELNGKKKYFVGETYRAEESACLICHSNNYTGIIEESRNLLNSTFSKIKEIFEKLKAISIDKPEIAQMIEPVGFNLNFVETSVSLHNIFYTGVILRNAVNEIVSLCEKEGLKIEDLQKMPLISGEFCATLCHKRFNVEVPKKLIIFKEKKMPHLKHFTEMGIVCTKCHEFMLHKETKFKGEEVCKECH